MLESKAPIPPISQTGKVLKHPDLIPNAAYPPIIGAINTENKPILKEEL